MKLLRKAVRRAYKNRAAILARKKNRLPPGLIVIDEDQFIKLSFKVLNKTKE